MLEKMLTKIAAIEGKEIVGVINYMETDTHIILERSGKTYMFRKATEELVVFD